MPTGSPGTPGSFFYASSSSPGATFSPGASISYNVAPSPTPAPVVVTGNVSVPYVTLLLCKALSGTSAPTHVPSSSPTSTRPSRSPSASPRSSAPTKSPTRRPSASPVSQLPTHSPTSASPSRSPSRTPTSSPNQPTMTNVPIDAIIWFSLDRSVGCPLGTTEVNATYQGRVFVGDSGANAGLSNTATNLASKTAPSHTHTDGTSVCGVTPTSTLTNYYIANALQGWDVLRAGVTLCTNGQGSVATASPSGYAFTQLLACRVTSASAFTVPLGSVLMFNPTTTSCPGGFSSLSAAQGRTVVPIQESLVPIASPTVSYVTSGTSMSTGFVQLNHAHAAPSSSLTMPTSSTGITTSPSGTVAQPGGTLTVSGNGWRSDQWRSRFTYRRPWLFQSQIMSCQLRAKLCI